MNKFEKCLTIKIRMILCFIFNNKSNIITEKLAFIYIKFNFRTRVETRAIIACNSISYNNEGRTAL